MKFTAEELAILESIPAGKKQELLTFAQFLRELHEKAKNTPKQKRERPRLVGALEGKSGCRMTSMIRLPYNKLGG